MTFRAGAIGLIGAAAVIAPVGPAGASTPQPPSPIAHVTVIGQNFDVTVGSTVRFDLQFTVAPQPGDELFVDIAPVTRRSDLRRTDDLPTVDSVTVPVGNLSGTGLVRRMEIPTEGGSERDGSLTVDTAGVYAVHVALTAQATAAETFVHFVDPDVETTPLPVAVVMGVTDGVGVDDLGAAHLSDEATSSIGRLVDALDACNAPVAVRLPAGTIAALAEHPDLRDRLVAALAGDELLSEPKLPLDPSSAAASAGSALYTEWLREGEDAANGVLGQPARRLVGVVDSPLSPAGAALRRDLGNRLLLFTTAQFDAVPATPGAFFDSSRVVRLSAGSGAGVDATIPDRGIGTALTSTYDSAAVAGASVAAELLLIRHDVVAAGGKPDQHGVVIATPDLATPPPATIAAVCDTITQTGGLRPVAVDDLAGRVEPVMVNGEPLTLNLAPLNSAQPSGADTLAAQRLRVVGSVAAMLPESDPRPQRWRTALAALPSTALDQAAVSRIVAGVDTEIAAVTSAVVAPAPFNATLGSRSATLRLNFTNNGLQTIKVRLHLTSGAGKINFPDNDRVYDLPPSTTTQLPIPIEARSNGRIPVMVEVLAPDGALPVGPAVPLTLTVNGISGLGYLLSGAAGLILVTWWVRHHRRLAAARRAATATLPDQ